MYTGRDGNQRTREHGNLLSFNVSSTKAAVEPVSAGGHANHKPTHRSSFVGRSRYFHRACVRSGAFNVGRSRSRVSSFTVHRVEGEVEVASSQPRYVRACSRMSKGVGLVGADHLDRAALFAVRPHRALAVQSCRARDAQFRDLRAGTRGG